MRNVLAAELGKLRTLPAVAVTVALTAAITTGLAAIAGFRALDYGQLGFIALGCVAAASEYGGQIRTSLVCVPNRSLLLTGKVAAYLVVAASTSVVTVVASAFVDRVPVLGARSLAAMGYLTFVGLVAFAMAVVLRNLVGALALMTTLVVVVPGVLPAVAEYLPGRAGLVLGCWVVVAMGIALVTFVKRDA